VSTTAREKIDRTLGALSLVAALTLCAIAEWQLALLASWPKEVAWCAPVLVDCYVVQSFRKQRDRRFSVPLIGATVSGSHVLPVVFPDGLPATWLAVISVIPVLVLWRIHEIGHAERADQTPPPAVTVTSIGPRPTVQRKPRTVLADQPQPRRITERADPGDLLAVGVEWVKAQPDYRTTLPSRPDIVAATGISDSTAKRVRAAVRKEIDVS
jgi:hypothetical protein